MIKGSKAQQLKILIAESVKKDMKNLINKDGKVGRQKRRKNGWKTN